MLMLVLLSIFHFAYIYPPFWLKPMEILFLQLTINEFVISLLVRTQTQCSTNEFVVSLLARTQCFCVLLIVAVIQNIVSNRMIV